MIIFAGPSIAGVSGPTLAPFDVRGPVKQGDVYLASQERPVAIGIIDGYFEGAPAVWHKEILWAMTQGIAVFGAASMGALRAAELYPLGMIGIGDIFRDYREEHIEDDDEVALLHGPGEVGYPALSLAMVNCRATLEAARQAGVITAERCETLVHVAKSQFYKTRTWDSVLHAANGPSDPDNLRNWIAENDVDLKKRDALQLLDHMAKGDFDAPVPAYHFEQTDLWVQAVRQWRAAAPTPSDGYRLFGDNGLFGG